MAVKQQSKRGAVALLWP